MEKTNEVKPPKKGFWAMFKESTKKTSAGCGPGCGCQVEQGSDNEKKDEKTSPKETGQE